MPPFPFCLCLSVSPVDCLLLDTSSLRQVEVAEASLNKQSKRAAGLQKWYDATAREALAAEKAVEEATKKAAAEAAAKQAEEDKKQQEYLPASSIHRA